MNWDRSAVVDVTPVSERDNDYKKDAVLDRVDHPIVADPDPPGIPPFQLLRIRWPGVIGEQGDRTLDPSSDLRIEPS